jgi:hypothetical protein
VDLYERKPRDALRNLNLARTDPVWGRRALAEMVAIYLNADFQELIASSVYIPPLFPSAVITTIRSRSGSDRRHSFWAS